MNLEPMEDKIIVKQIKAEQPATKSGIILPPSEESQETPFTGTVLAIGPGEWSKTSPLQRVPMTVKVGDIVIFSRHGHQKFRYQGEDLITFGESSIIGIVRNSEPMNLYP